MANRENYLSVRHLLALRSFYEWHTGNYAPNGANPVAAPYIPKKGEPCLEVYGSETGLLTENNAQYVAIAGVKYFQGAGFNEHDSTQKLRDFYTNHGTDAVRIKIGDGLTPYYQLPYVDEGFVYKSDFEAYMAAMASGMRYRGTTSAIPTDADMKAGDTWKVAASFVINGVTTKAGDTLVRNDSNGFDLIPSADDVEYRPIYHNGTEVFGVANGQVINFAQGNHITISATDLLDSLNNTIGKTLTFNHNAAGTGTTHNVATDGNVLAGLAYDARGHITGFTEKGFTFNGDGTYTEVNQDTTNKYKYTFKHKTKTVTGTLPTAQTATFGGTVNIPTFTYDGAGHIATVGSVAVTMPSTYKLTLQMGSTSSPTFIGDNYNASAARTYTIPIAGAGLGVVKEGASDTANNKYKVDIASDGGMSVNVPLVAYTGTTNQIDLNSTTHAFSLADILTSAQAGTFGSNTAGSVGTFVVPKITVDQKGRITSIQNVSLTTISAKDGTFTLKVGGTVVNGSDSDNNSANFSANTDKNITYDIPLASASAAGVVKTTAAPTSDTTGRVYYPYMDGGKLAVYVPWADTDTVYTGTSPISVNATTHVISISKATNSALGVVKGGTNGTGANNRTYGVSIDAKGAMTVNVPWLEYTGANGITVDGTIIKHTNSIVADNVGGQGDSTTALTFGGTFKTIKLNYDAHGHIVAAVEETLTMPTVATVATSGDYNDLINKPTIPIHKTLELVGKYSTYNPATNAWTGYGQVSIGQFTNAADTTLEIPIPGALKDLVNNLDKLKIKGASDGYNGAKEATIDIVDGASSTDISWYKQNGSGTENLRKTFIPSVSMDYDGTAGDDVQHTAISGIDAHLLRQQNTDVLVLNGNF